MFKKLKSQIREIMSGKSCPFGMYYVYCPGIINGGFARLSVLLSVGIKAISSRRFLSTTGELLLGVHFAFAHNKTITRRIARPWGLTNVVELWDDCLITKVLSTWKPLWSCQSVVSCEMEPQLRPSTTAVRQQLFDAIKSSINGSATFISAQ